jgi:lysozyme
MAEKVEEHYKVKPIIIRERYYDDFLKQEFSDYLLIANYNLYQEEIKRRVVLAVFRKSISQWN